MRTLILSSVVALGVTIGTVYASGLFVSPEANSPTCNIQNDKLLEIKGKVAAVRPAKGELVVSENVKSWTFQLTKDAKVLINDREAKLADLMAGDDAAVTFDRQGQQLLATLIRASRK